MHAVKGSWVGQTFALAATCSSDSGGKKARIRRSKEERKEMVESFIKRYQKLNNGSFPSLNLTHKEVGGSFYIVREIIREVIQENRVLGPAKLSLEEQNDHAFLEQYPLGSISTEPNLLSSEETHVISNLLHVLDSNETFHEPENKVRKDQESDKSFISLSDEKTSEEFALTTDDEETCIEQVKSSRYEKQVESILEEGSFGSKKDVAKEQEGLELEMSRITADIEVEHFPLRPISKTISEKSGELNGSVSRNENDRVIQEGLNMENNEEMVYEEAVLSTILECTNGSTIKMNTEPAHNVVKDVEKASPTEIKPVIAHNANQERFEVQHDSSTENEKSPTINKISLENPDEESKKPVGPEHNPLLASLKAFITAFVKFWTE